MYVNFFRPWLSTDQRQEVKNEKTSSKNWKRALVEERIELANGEKGSVIAIDGKTYDCLKTREIKCLYNEKTGRMYDPSTKMSVAFEHLGMFVATPLYMVAQMIYHIFRIVIGPIYAFFQNLYVFFKSYKEESFCANLSNSFVLFTAQALGEALSDIWDLVKSPFYAIGMLFASGYGLARPFEGRFIISQIDCAWKHGNIRRENDFFRNPKLLLRNEHVVFLTYCMQIIGKINNGKKDIHAAADSLIIKDETGTMKRIPRFEVKNLSDFHTKKAAS